VQAVYAISAFHMQSLKLPDPLLPNSLADVTYAAQCVSNAGITIEGFGEWASEIWKDELFEREISPSTTGVDAACAELVRAASSVVTPPAVYKFSRFALTTFPQTTTAMIRWLSPTLQQLHIKGHEEPLHPWLWQELHQCCKLKEVHVLEGEAEGGGHGCQGTFFTLLQLAATRYVTVIQRPLKLTFSGWRGPNRPSKHNLQKEIQAKLPSCVILQEYDWQECSGCGAKYCKWDVCGNCLTVRLVPAGQQQHGHLAGQMRNLNIKHGLTFM
jgi:hypothetical protein